jgi:hypothetical protein
MSGAEGVQRPVVRIDGEIVPAQPASPGSGAPVLDIHRASEVSIQVLGATPAGTHSGSLVLERVSGAGSLPRTLTTRITVEVTGGFWRSWFLLRDWLLFVVVLAVLLYGFCLWNFPPPSGFLGLCEADGRQIGPIQIRLRLRRVAWLLPWERSTVPLGWVWKHSAAKFTLNPRGEMVFLYRGIPALFVLQRGRGVNFAKWRGGEKDLEMLTPEDFSPCGSINVMHSGLVVRQSVGEYQYLLLTYESSSARKRYH